MRIGLLTEGGRTYAPGGSTLWCDRLVRGLAQHEFDIYALGRGDGVPSRVRRVRTASLWTTEDEHRVHDAYGSTGARPYGRRERRRFATHFGELAAAVCAVPGTPGASGEGFASGLYGLAGLARERGGLRAALRSDTALRILETVCRAPGVRRGVHGAGVADHLALAERLEQALRPLSLDWYGEETLGAADLCHALSGGPAALPGLLAKRLFGTPLLVTEYRAHLHTYYLESAGAPLGTPVRALLAAFHGHLAAEAYRQAAVITPGSGHVRRWQERSGAAPAKLRTVHPGTEAAPFAPVGEGGDGGDPHTLVWVGRPEPAKDLAGLLRAFTEVRARESRARLRLIAVPAHDPEAAAYLAHCRALAARLFPEEASGAGGRPVSFEEVGGPRVPDLAGAYAAGCVAVLSSTAEDFPVGLVEAMLCARATVSTDVGAVAEVVGGTGLVVPPGDPRALADACLALLRDPGRRARLGAAARDRARELFTAERSLAAFHGIYLELISQAPVRRAAQTVDADGGPLPFAHPAEARVPGNWAGRGAVPVRPAQPVGAGTGGGDV